MTKQPLARASGMALALVACADPLPPASDDTTTARADTTMDSGATESTLPESSGAPASTGSSGDGQDDSSSAETASESGVCGDGHVDADEDCDDRAVSAECDEDCTFVMCGDGFVNRAGDEQCDDANRDDADGCDSDCTESIVVAVTCGDQHTCALSDTGTVHCWGAGESGRLGYGNEDDVGDNELPSAVGPVQLGAPVIQISAGGRHTCALLEDSNLRCWGEGYYGQLGLSNTDNVGDDELPSSRNAVLRPNAITGVASGGVHTCTVLDSNALRCFGSNYDGELGQGNTENIGDNEYPVSTPSVILGDTVAQVEPGFAHTCAVLGNAQDVVCWGRNVYGQLGYSHTFNIGDDEPPTDSGVVQLGGPVLAVAGGTFHSCALLMNGTVRCWGDGYDGRLGYGNTDAIGDDETPLIVDPVDLGGVAIAVTAGGAHTCALLDTHDARCWGSNQFGQLGTAEMDWIGDDEAPGTIDTIDVGGPISQIAAGESHTCALLDTGRVRCWGSGLYGQLGYGDDENIGDNFPPSSAGDVEVF